MSELFSFKGKELLLALFLIFFLTSCQKKPPEWQYDKILASNSCFNSARLTFPVTDPFSGLEIELMRNVSGMRMYLNAYSQSFPYDESHPEIVQVTIQLPGESPLVIDAQRLAGGQRLLLPDEAAELIVYALLNGRGLDIFVGHYHAEIPSENFNPLFTQFSTSVPVCEIQ